MKRDVGCETVDGVQHLSVSNKPVSCELSRDEGLRLLGDVSFGRICFISKAMPALRVVSHVLDGEDLLIGLASDAEIAALLSRVSHVVYQADLLDPATRYGWSVVLTGRAGLVEDTGEIARARNSLIPLPGQCLDLVVRIHPELVAGFRATAGDGTSR